MPFEHIQVPVQNLHLDPDNSRHNQTNDEREIVKHLYEKEKVDNLLKDIAIHGFSPLDRIGVIPCEGTPNHYTVVEGNRRLCALKLLLDEEIAPTEAIRTQVIRARRLLQSPLPTNLLVCKFDTLDDASPWIDRRHLGEMGGIGTRSWGPDEQLRSLARAERSDLSTTSTVQQNTLAQMIMDRLYALGKLSTGNRKNIPLTTISRYLSTPAVREVLGLGHNSNLIYNYIDEEVDEALARFVTDALPDLANGVEPPRVHSRSDASDRRAYALEFAERGFRPTTKRPPSPPVAAPSCSPQKESNPPEPRDNNAGNPSMPIGGLIPDQTVLQTAGLRGTRDPSLRPHLAPTSFSIIAPDDPMLIRIYKELKKIYVENHEFSCNYLLRAFIERIMIRFLRFNGVETPSNLTDQVMTQRCRELASRLNASRAIDSILGKAASNPNIGHSLTALGAAVHCAHAPTKRELLAHFDTWTPALVFMLEHSL